MPAAIIGLEGSGVNTFTGLLYAAQVKYTNEDQLTRENYRFYASPKGLSVISQLYHQMMKSQWPGNAINGQKSLIEFIFGYKQTNESVLPKWIVKNGWANPFSTIKFNVYGISEDELNSWSNSAKDCRIHTDKLSGITTSTAIVLVLDSGMAGYSAPPGSESPSYDDKASQLLKVVLDSEPVLPGQRIELVIVMAKFDNFMRASEEKTLEGAGITADLTKYSGLSDRKRTKSLSNALKTFFPQTHDTIQYYMDKRHCREPTIVYSYVKTKRNEDGSISPVLKPIEDGTFRGMEIDFSYGEYKRFILHFRKIAREMPDDIRDSQDIALEDKDTPLT